MTMSTTNRSTQVLRRSPRRLLISRGLVAALGTLAGRLPSDSAARQRRQRGKGGKSSRKKTRCCKPGDACRKHSDCCSGSGMCVAMVQDGGESSSRRCAVA
jgi:hypothetical protein